MRNASAGRSKAVSRESMERLTHYAWPGNVRELENVDRARTRAVAGRRPRHRPRLPAALEPPPVARPAAAPVGPVATLGATAPSGSGTLEGVERAHILATLAQTNWVIEGPRGAARILAMHPNTLRSRMKKLGLERGRHEISLPPEAEGA